jgi:hypothetical protein
MVYLKAFLIGFIVLGIVALKSLSSQLGNLEWFIGNVASFQKTTAVDNTNQIIDQEKKGLVAGEGLKISDFRYPDAEVVKFEEDSFHLKSSDNIEEVTNWYKKKISDNKIGIRNFIQTNTNGNFSNLLQGASEDENIKVEIEKTSSDSDVNILVTLNNL